MNATYLLEHFDRLIEAPYAVARLRRFIQDLAIRGKLVEQNSDDEPAMLLLAQVAAEWTRLEKEGRAKRSKDVKELAERDGPFASPSLWKFVCLGEVLQMFNGRAFKRTDWLDRGLPIIRIQNLNNPSATFNFCDPSKVDKRHLVNNGDFLISWSGTPGTSFGAFIWERGEGALNQHIFRCTQVGNAYEPKFLRLAINTQLNVLISQAQGGVGLQHVTRGTLERLPLALPPRAEQGRIVAKVEELMELCDQLEIAQKERDDHRNHLVAASLQRLNQSTESDGPETYRKYAHFHLTHLARLTTSKEHIKAFRLTLLNCAVKGRLVPHDQNDEPATELLEKIKLEKSRQLKNTRKTRETSEAVGLDLEPYPLPIGWAWARFPDLGVFGRGKSKHRPRNDPALFDGGTYPLVQTGDVARSGGLIKTYTGMYNDLGLSQSMLWPAGTLCITIAANIADSGILAFDACFPDSVVGFNPSPLIDSAKYFEYFVRTAKSNLLEFAPATAQKNINLEILNAVLVPVPPVAEQSRIAKKVDELLSLCDDLEIQLSTIQADSERLLDTLFDDALGIFRAPTEEKSQGMLSVKPISDHQIEKASLYMTSNPAATVDQLTGCVDSLGGTTTPERLLKFCGLSEDLETFYDLLRAARDQNSLIVPLGSDQEIRRHSGEN